MRLKLTSNVFFTSLYDYSFAKDQAFNQAYGLTYQHGCWALTLAYREEGNDQQVYFTFNLLGLGNLGAGISPGSGSSLDGTKTLKRWDISLDKARCHLL